MNVDVAVVIESHLTRRAEGRRNDGVVQVRIRTDKDQRGQGEFGHEDLIDY